MLEPLLIFGSERTEIYQGPGFFFLRPCKDSRALGSKMTKRVRFTVFIVFPQNGPKENSASWQMVGALKVSDVMKDT